MDHLQEARTWMEASRDAWDEGMNPIAGANARFAIAYALIALVERLDGLVVEDEQGRPALNVINYVYVAGFGEKM